MLAIARAPSPSRRTFTPNIIPASIKHNGPVPFDNRYWIAVEDDDEEAEALQQTAVSSTDTAVNENDQADSESDGKAKTTTTTTAYFRGRKLRGQVVEIPSGYEGVVLEKTGKMLPTKRPTAEQLRLMEEQWDEDAIQEEKPLEVRLMEVKGRFDNLVVWGHELLPDTEDDVIIRGVQEWIGFAESMHIDEEMSTSAENIAT